MPVERAKAFPLSDVLRNGGPLAAPTRLRIALDVLEPIAAASVGAPVGPRRAGSRHVIANVVVGVRGKAKLVGRGNRTGVQLLLWELLAGRAAPDAHVPPLGAVVEDVEPDVAEVVAAAIARRADLADARALLKALVIASAGFVGTHRDVAKAIGELVGAAAAASTTAAVPREAAPAIRSVSTMLPPPTSSTVPQPTGSAASEEEAAAADLDAILSEELDRIAPHGWDDFGLAPPPEVASVEDPEMLDDDLVEVAPESRPVAPPPLPAGATTHSGRRVDVLMIEPDAFTASHLAAVLRRAGYEVEACARPELAVTRACVTQPGCVLCDDEVVEGGGVALALRARNNSPRACLAPFIFLAAHPQAGDAPRRKSGARDVWLAKPFSTEALVDAVGQLVGPIVTKADSSMLPVGESAMDGSLSLISLRTLIKMLELERRSGVLRITSQDRDASITLREGRATRAKVLGRSVSAVTALETLLAWRDGRFTFQPALVAVAASASAWHAPSAARSISGPKT